MADPVKTLEIKTRLPEISTATGISFTLARLFGAINWSWWYVTLPFDVTYLVLAIMIGAIVLWLRL